MGIRTSIATEVRVPITFHLPTPHGDSCFILSVSVISLLLHKSKAEAMTNVLKHSRDYVA